eukprot:6713982-Alexandrium_andersonii.AAC.1
MHASMKAFHPSVIQRDESQARGGHLQLRQGVEPTPVQKLQTLRAKDAVVPEPLRCQGVVLEPLP